MVIDGVAVNLTSTVAWVAGVSYSAPFTGTLNGLPVGVIFCVNATGTNPKVTAADIPGHPGAMFSLTKETSTALIEAYEGTYTNANGDKGTFNIALSRSLDTFTGIMSVNGTTFCANLSGTIINGNLVDTVLSTIGTINGDKITGTFNDSNNISTTFTSKRTIVINIEVGGVILRTSKDACRGLPCPVRRLRLTVYMFERVQAQTKLLRERRRSRLQLPSGVDA